MAPVRFLNNYPTSEQVCVSCCLMAPKTKKRLKSEGSWPGTECHMPYICFEKRWSGCAVFSRACLRISAKLKLVRSTKYETLAQRRGPEGGRGVNELLLLLLTDNNQPRLLCLERFCREGFETFFSDVRVA